MNIEEISAVDSHVHLYNKDCIDYFLKYRTDNNFEAVNVACLCNLNSDMVNDPTQNILAAIIKLKDSHFYAHCGLVYPEFPVNDPVSDEYDYVNQIDELMKIGFDGFKMLEAKPTVRKMTGVGVNNRIFDGLYTYLEKNDIPVICHVADPETFWDAKTAPEFSFSEGWFYGDGTFATKEQLYEEINEVVEKYPKIRFTFPHFFFLSDFPETADRYLTEHKQIFFDITPGREMYENFAKHYDETVGLFKKYNDRIMFGTDINTVFYQGTVKGQINTMKRFLCTDDNFDFSEWGFEIHGIGLPGEMYDNILKNNFYDRVGKEPRKINRNLLGKYIEKRGNGIKNQKTKEFIYKFAEKEL